jgi:hypothetical protein
MCSFSQNGPIFVKFPVIFLQLFVPDPDRIHTCRLDLRLGSGGGEPCVRISLRFRWQGGAPGAGGASMDSRVRIPFGERRKDDLVRQLNALEQAAKAVM